MSPLVAISGVEMPVDGPVGRVPWLGVSRVYVDSVRRAGGVGVILPPSPPEAAHRILRPFDGIVLTGGGDLSPRLYGEVSSPQVYGVAEDRDAFEVQLLRVALDAELPVLAICRGMHLLNVIAGGSLEQHIASGDHLCVADAYLGDAHVVEVEEGSQLRQLLGSGRLRVNSLHHQSVARLGTGVVVSARSEDGCIEALELCDNRNAIGVQWHPELLPQVVAHRALFDWLLATAEGASRSSRP